MLAGEFFVNFYGKMIQVYHKLLTIEFNHEVVSLFAQIHAHEFSGQSNFDTLPKQISWGISEVQKEISYVKESKLEMIQRSLSAKKLFTFGWW